MKILAKLHVHDLNKASQPFPKTVSHINTSVSSSIMQEQQRIGCDVLTQINHAYMHAGMYHHREE